MDVGEEMEVRGPAGGGEQHTNMQGRDCYTWTKRSSNKMGDDLTHDGSWNRHEGNQKNEPLIDQIRTLCSVTLQNQTS